MRRWVVAIGMAASVGSLPMPAQAQLAAESAEDVRAAVRRLGDFDYDVRNEASRAIRRAAPEVAVPILRDALQQYEDSYVQFRAAVLYFGFNPPDSPAVFRTAIESANDRIRTAAYDYFTFEPDLAVVPRLLAALDTETSEFVRPALIRALAAQGDLPAVRERLVREIDRGQEYFRGAVIEALGDYHAEGAVDSLVDIVGVEGPLRDDAILALGKIGDRRALAVLRRIQPESSERLQPVIAAAACLLDVECDDQIAYLEGVLRYAANRDDEQERVRSAASGLAALAATGNQRALALLFEVGAIANSAARAPIALAAGSVTLRWPALIVEALTDGTRSLVEPMHLLRDAFDMLDEDLAEERFYMLMRRTYWDAPAESAARRAAGEAIDVLEF